MEEGDKGNHQRRSRLGQAPPVLVGQFGCSGVEQDDIRPGGILKKVSAEVGELSWLEEPPPAIANRPLGSFFCYLRG